MSKLQNNFTTPEQSKRLLELRVPADSADYYFEKCTGDICIIKKGTFSTFCDKNEIPCWSVGRLIEIYEICTHHKFKRVQLTSNLVYLSPLEDVMMQIEHNACGFFDNTKWDTNLLNG